MKVCIATARDIGLRCKKVAREKIKNLDGFELIDDIKECDILISVLYDKLLKAPFLQNKRCYNFHPGILPEYRGAGTFSWSIINQENEAGITLHIIDAGIDSGDIIDIARFPILEIDTAESLFTRGEEVIVHMFECWFEKLLHEDFEAEVQDESRAKIYYRKDLQKAKDLTRYARAFHFTGKESAFYLDHESRKKYLEYKGGEK